MTFDEHWLADATWRAVDASDGLQRWQLGGPSLQRHWLLICAEPQASPWALARLDREYAIAPRLERAWAAVPVMQLTTAKGPSLVLDSGGGLPLSCLAHGTLSVERFLDIARAAAAALAQAHRHGIVHRDLRPQNLLLSEPATVRLTGFACATLGGDTSAAALQPCDSSLAYLSPEQAGRHGGSASAASDLYALGVCFFQLLTGQLPFSASDALQWRHQHVAVPAPSLLGYRPGLPPALDDLLTSLLHKEAEQRPASAQQLEAELQRLLNEWRELGSLRRSLVPRSQDAGQRQAPLVGRAHELSVLQQAVAQLLQGQGGTLLIQGEAGIGKTSLLRHLRRQPTTAPLLFAMGTCHAGRRHLPYAALGSALASLFSRLMGEAPADIICWGQRLRDALGTQASLLAGVVPELEWLTGPLQSTDEAHGPLPEILLRLLGVIASAELPLLLFLDDVQWIDAQSLAFLHALPDSGFAHLLLIGTCRSDTLAARADLRAFVEHCRSLGPRAGELTLGALEMPDVATLLGSALALHPDEQTLLAGRLTQRGNGNPAYVSQAIAVLQESAGAEQPTAQPVLLDDVAAIMRSRLERLPPATRQLLGQLALLGNHTPLADLAAVADTPLDTLITLLRPAFETGLIGEYQQGAYFTHDVVWEAAREQLSDTERRALHLKSAVTLLERLPTDAEAEAVFRVAAHVLHSGADVLSAAQQQRFFHLLMHAAQLAKACAAAPTALVYLRQARHLLEAMQPLDESLSHALTLLNVHCLMLNADYTAAQAGIARLLEQTTAPFDRAQLYKLTCEIHSLRGDYAAALSTAADGLLALGFDLPVAPSEAQAETAWQAAQQALARCPAGQFEHLPRLEDSRLLATVELLATCVIPGSFIHPQLMLVTASHIVQLSVAHGGSPAAAHGLAWLGVAIAHRFDACQQGFELAASARQLAELPAYASSRVSVLTALDQVSVWSRPIAYALECAESALRTSLAQGLPSFACYANNHIVSDLLVMGAPIERMLRQIDTGLTLARNLAFADGQSILQVQALYIRRLAGVQEHALPIPEPAQIARHVAQSHMGPLHFWWNLFEGLFQFLEGAFECASDYLDRAQALAWAAPAHIHLIDLALFTVLNRAALQTASGVAQDFEAPMNSLRHWAALNPRNFADRLALAEAELLRIDGQVLDALRHYEDAIHQATQCGAIHIRGLAHEMESRCLHALGLHVGAQTHLRLARDAWRRWGAHTLAEQLEAEHAFLREPPAATHGMALPASEQLDMMAITRACQALSREIEADALIKTLLSNTVLHAGATYTALVLVDAGGLKVEATGRVDREGVDIRLRSGPVTGEAAPLGLVLSVMSTRTSLAISGADALRRFGDVAYLMRSERASIACVPLLKQNEVIGALYLENTLTPGLFVPARLDVLELLAAQAAISLSNARLYSDLREENQRRLTSEGHLRLARSELDRTAQATILGELAASIAHEINQPLASILSNAGASVRWLERAQPRIEDALEGIRDILDQGQRAADIVNAMRALAKQARPASDEIEIGAVIARVLAVTEAEIHARQVNVTLSLEPGLRVRGDAVQLQQVLYNLISNAVDAMQALPPAARQLRVQTCAMAGEVLIVLQDSGPGVAPEDQERVFQAFFSTKASGMGMGLAICASIVAAHGGSLRATLGRDGESQFFFTLPQVPAVF